MGRGSSVARAQGELVDLRAPTATDQGTFLAAVERSMEFLHPWVRPPLDPAGYRQLLQRAISHDNVISLVIDRSDGGIAGMVNINNIVRGGFLNGQLGYYALAPKAGSGLLTSGLKLAVTYAFGDLGLHRLEANIQPGNIKSLNLARRCGFHLEGFAPDYLFINGAWRDHEHWVIRADTPSEANQPGVQR